MKKKILAIFIALALVLINSTFVLAQIPDFGETIALKIGNPRALFNSELVLIDEENPLVIPIIRNSRTLLPIKFLAEKFEMEVIWENEKREVRIISGEKELSFVIDSNIANVNGENIELEQPAIITNERTFLPVRIIADFFQTKIEWNNDERIIYINEVKDEKGIDELFKKSVIKVDFIDVGQGDSILVESWGETMLIDTGSAKEKNKFFNHLGMLEKLEYLILTHPHEDHIGNAKTLLEKTRVENILKPDAKTGTKVQQTLDEKIAEQNIPTHYPEQGESFRVGDAVVFILSEKKSYKNINDYSLVLKVQFGEKTFLFTGDAEKEAELGTLNMDLKSDVLKVSHHGSKSSTIPEFFESVSPKIAIISCGMGNSYGHPHEETLEKLKFVLVLRTDIHSTVTIFADGEKIIINNNLSC